MSEESRKPDRIVRGWMLPEFLRVLTTIPMSDCLQLVGTGLRSSSACEPIPTPAPAAELEASLRNFLLEARGVRRDGQD